MKEIRLLVCDLDEAYLDAVVRFLLGSKKDFVVNTYTDLDIFREDRGRYEIGLLTTPFLEAYDKGDILSEIGEVLQLSDSMEPPFKTYEKLYKFQAMDQFLDRILRTSYLVPEERIRNGADIRYLAVYSPMHHELTLPFSLLLSRLMLTEGSVLFVDMEASSILPELLNHVPEKNLLDYLYMLEVSEPEAGDIYEFCDHYEGISILPPVRSPAEIGSIRIEQWRRLMEGLSKEKFQVVVLLFDEVHVGFEEMVEYCDELVLVSRPGDYYRKYERTFLKYLKLSGITTEIREISLPMSANNLTDGSYQMEELFQGNLGNFIRRNFDVGLAYGG